MRSSPILLKQKLSPKAAAAKKKRDVAMAKTTVRKAKKAQNQRIGQKPGSDLHTILNLVEYEEYRLKATEVILEEELN